MSMDMFLKLGAIKGESIDHKYKDQIEILAFSWGSSNSGTRHIARGGGAGKANFQDLSLTKWIDMASPDIWKSVASGKHLPDATLTIRKAGGDAPVDYMVIDMTDVMITSVSSGGSGGEDRLTENITLNFAQFKIKYTEQDITGSKGTDATMGWNIPQNTAV